MDRRQSTGKESYQGPDVAEQVTIPVLNAIPEAQARKEREAARPRIDYSSFSGFVHTVSHRTKSIFTKRFILALLAGQLLSICITCTNVTTTELVNRNWANPTTQSFFLYVASVYCVGSILIEFENCRYFTLFSVYTPYTIYQYGFKGWFKMLYTDGWKCVFLSSALRERLADSTSALDLIMAAADVEANFMVVLVRSACQAP